MSRRLCYRGAANTWECDEMGHMNVRFYLGKAHQGLVHAGVMIGLGPKALAAMGAELVVDDQHIRFLRELRAGADLSIDAGVVEVDGNSMTLYQEVLPLAASHVSATLITKVALRDVETGADRDFPETVIEKAKALLTNIPDYANPRTLSLDIDVSGSDQAAAIRSGHLDVCVATIRSDQVDELGHLYPEQYIGHISDGIGNLFGLLTKGPDEAIYERSDGIGGAALEYRFQFLKRARVGDALKVWSAPVRLQEKTWVLEHVIVNGETGETFVRANSVHISFDLKTRKSIPVPDLLRRGIEGHLARSS